MLAIFPAAVVLLFGFLSTNANAACCGNNDPFLYDKFPDGFIWSSATSSYQIEGGWNASGKGESIWDNYTHRFCCIERNETGDIACDSYHKYKEDVQLLKQLGVQYYRFSISWPRVMSDGTNATINRPGIDYYKNLIAELKKNGIQPMATLYHWDLPQALQDRYGGWENETLIGLFREYARLCFTEFGNDVKLWLTFNEPWIVSIFGYDVGDAAPGVKRTGIGAYTTAHILIKAHAEAWHLYNDEFRASQKGRIAITLNSDYKQPKTDSAEDKAASDRGLQFMLGWFAHPIFKNGDYPDVMKSAMAERSRKQGFPKSRLPEFTEEEKKRIKGTSDFFGLNHYTTQMVSPNKHPANYTPAPGYFNDIDNKEETDHANWPSAGTPWQFVVPWGFRKLLKWIKDEYNDPDIFVTENGMSDRNKTMEGIFNDTHRIFYFKHYINNMLKAIKVDKCRVIGYTAWSLLDNFEWNQGYEPKFGLFYVNFSDPDRTRRTKDSARYYSQLIKDNGFIAPVSESTRIHLWAPCLLTVIATYFL